jgi:hypothetical protein
MTETKLQFRTDWVLESARQEVRMASSAERIGQLKLAGEFCLFDKKLVSSGNSSIVGLAQRSVWCVVPD